MRYDAFWAHVGTVRLGPWSASLDLRTGVDSGLMTLFFLVAGLEPRRGFDLGDLRGRRRLMLPVLAGMAGMALPVGIYVIVSHGGPGVRGWGAAMSTDTALALAAFALVARHARERIRIFVLTLSVVDDLVALVVIAIARSAHVRLPGLAVAVVAYALLLASRRLSQRCRAWGYAALTAVTWAGLLSCGIDPVVAGLAAGLATSAYTPNRMELEEATKPVRLFRDQPSPELARSATRSLTGALSANARLRSRLHAATSYLIVLFALANLGIVIDGPLLSRAVRSPITIGIVAAYVVGKPVAVVVTACLTERFSRGAVRPPVGWGAVLGSGTIAGIGLTVSLLIAGVAFFGAALDEAKIGTLVAALAAPLLSLAVPPGDRRARARIRALLGTADRLVDLAEPADSDRDHVRGPSCCPTRTDWVPATSSGTPRGSASTPSDSERTRHLSLREPGRAGRLLRRPQRRPRHTHVLHQRPAARRHDDLVTLSQVIGEARAQALAI